MQSTLNTLFFDLQLPLAGRTYVQSSINAGPSRDVQGRRGNSLFRFKSKKSDATVLLESRSGEFPAAVLMERNPAVLAFYAQPQKVELTIRNEEGRAVTRTMYTPDFLVIHKTGILVREYRDEASLVSQMARSPYQYYMDADGAWHYRAAEETFGAMGLGYEVVSNSRLPACLVNNARFLEDYAAEDAPKLSEQQRSELRCVIEANRFVPFRKLLDEHGFSADTIFMGVADGLVYVDLERDRLDATDALTIFADEVTCRAHQAVVASTQEKVLPIPGMAHMRTGAKFRFGNKEFSVLLVGERDISVIDEDGVITKMGLQTLIQLNDLKMLEGDPLRGAPEVKQLADFSKDELGRALVRLNAVQTNDTSALSSRSLARYRAAVENSTSDLDALISLTDLQRQRGNRSARLSDEVEELAKRAVEMRFNTPERPPKKGAYAQYVIDCEKRSVETGIKLTPMSYPTFCKRCDDFESVRKREGKRSAYQKNVIVQMLDAAVYPVHGVRPHEVCYIDHTIINLATVGPDGTEMGKPTFSVAVDGNSTQPRAMVLSYDPPSTWTVLLVLRDYVRRNGRLPRLLSVDNGKEFHSKVLELVAKLLGIDIRYRAPGMPRGGAMVERLIGATEQEVVAHMEGNTRQMKDPRLVTKSVNPFNRAVWTLTAAYFALEEYLFEVRPNRIHPALGKTPNEYEAQRMHETGERSHRLVAFNEDFMLLTAPHAHRKMHKVDKRRGVWVDGQWYRHPEMDRLQRGEKVEVKVEPWCFNVIYVYIRDHWVAAIGSNSRAFAGRHRAEVHLAMRAERRRALNAANKDTLNMRTLKNTEKLWSPELYDPRISAQQREMKHLFTRIGMTTSLPLPKEAYETPESGDVPQFARSVGPKADNHSSDAAGDRGPADDESTSAQSATAMDTSSAATKADPRKRADPVDDRDEVEDEEDNEENTNGVFGNVTGYY